jgi:2-amino-4-hydroxy-6-hydroxymethyldihydropteridine diphosphokinase
VRQVAFGLGSNIGDKQGNVAAALAALFDGAAVRFVSASSFYRTAPWGHAAQDWFVNACALGATELSPHALLARCKAVEAAVGRTATFRWGPRVIDIDILWIEGEAIDDPDLVIPHREILNRAFVLVPLAEILPDLVIGGVRVAEAATAPSEMERLADAWAPSKPGWPGQARP